MNPSRQIQRREMFEIAVANMPHWETWMLPEIPGQATIDGVTGKRLPRGNFKLIPRRVRRSMARAKSQREWKDSRIKQG